jgi:hypothetical protein
LPFADEVDNFRNLKFSFWQAVELSKDSATWGFTASAVHKGWYNVLPLLRLVTKQPAWVARGSDGRVTKATDESLARGVVDEGEWYYKGRLEEGVGVEVETRLLVLEYEQAAEVVVAAGMLAGQASYTGQRMLTGAAQHVVGGKRPAPGSEQSEIAAELLPELMHAAAAGTDVAGDQDGACDGTAAEDQVADSTVVSDLVKSKLADRLVASSALRGELAGEAITATFSLVIVTVCM